MKNDQKSPKNTIFDIPSAKTLPGFSSRKRGPKAVIWALFRTVFSGRIRSYFFFGFFHPFSLTSTTSHRGPLMPSPALPGTLQRPFFFGRPRSIRIFPTVRRSYTPGLTNFPMRFFNLGLCLSCRKGLYNIQSI